MDLPGKANDPPFRELVYSRLLCKRWIALTVGFFPVSTVEVWEYSGPEPMLRVDGLPPVPALPDFPRTEGVVETRRDAGSDPADGVFRTAVVWLPNAAGVVAVRVKTCPDTVGTEADILRVPIDDAVFKRIVESIRLDGRVPPTVDLGRLPDRVRTLPALPEQGNR